MRPPPRMVLSATAGMGAACFCHPLDVVRVQMQIPSKDGSKAYTGTVDAVTQARAFDAVNGPFVFVVDARTRVYGILWHRGDQGPACAWLYMMCVPMSVSVAVAH